MALPSCRCVGAYPNWKLLGPIVAAARTWAGESPDLHCFDNRPIIDQLRGLYCATLTVSGGGGGGGATLLASFYIPEIVDSFERSQAAGYSGNGDPDTFQREAAVDVLRDSHYQSGIDGQLVILEDDPTFCILVAPGIPEVIPGVGVYDAIFDPIPVTVSLLKYQYRLTGAVDWEDNGTSTTITGAEGSAGIHTLEVRAVSTSGVVGDVAISEEFEIETAGGLSDYSNLTAWYYTPIAGASDGNPIPDWPDGQGSFDLTSTGTEPTYQTNEINGFAAVQFNANYLNTGGSSASGFPRTLVIVANFEEIFDYQILFGCSGSGGLNLRTNQFSNVLNCDKAQEANIGTGDVAVTAGWHVIIAVITSSTWAFWIDGVDAGSGAHSESLTGGRTFTLGGDGSGSAFIWKNMIVEAGIFDFDHTSNVAAITSGLETKYGL